jgi:hypothetical protein
MLIPTIKPQHSGKVFSIDHILKFNGNILHRPDLHICDVIYTNWMVPLFSHDDNITKTGTVPAIACWIKYDGGLYPVIIKRMMRRKTSGITICIADEMKPLFGLNKSGTHYLMLNGIISCGSESWLDNHGIISCKYLTGIGEYVVYRASTVRKDNKLYFNIPDMVRSDEVDISILSHFRYIINSDLYGMEHVLTHDSELFSYGDGFQVLGSSRRSGLESESDILQSERCKFIIQQLELNNDNYNEKIINFTAQLYKICMRIHTDSMVYIDDIRNTIINMMMSYLENHHSAD